jgi:hypothetical protein
MTAPTSPLHAVPPPLELRDGDLLVGWIDGDMVRFRGFGSARGASHAAVVAQQAMLRRLARGNRATTSEMETDLGTLRRMTDHASATANGRPIASGLRSFIEEIGGSSSDDFTFEVRVPSPIDELRMRGMAYVMYRALRSSGLAWPLLRPVDLPEALTATVTDAAAERNTSMNGITSRAFNVSRRMLGRAAGAWALPPTSADRLS